MNVTKLLCMYYVFPWMGTERFPFKFHSFFETVISKPFKVFIKPFKVFINPFLVFLKPLKYFKNLSVFFQNKKNVRNKCSLDVKRGKVILKGVFSKPSGNCIVVPNFCLLS